MEIYDLIVDGYPVACHVKDICFLQNGRAYGLLLPIDGSEDIYYCKMDKDSGEFTLIENEIEWDYAEQGFMKVFEQRISEDEEGYEIPEEVCEDEGSYLQLCINGIDTQWDVLRIFECNMKTYAAVIPVDRNLGSWEVVRFKGGIFNSTYIPIKKEREYLDACRKYEELLSEE